MVLGYVWTNKNIYVFFIFIDAPTSYNIIMGRIIINPNKIILSILHQKMKFLTHEIGKVLGDQPTFRKCYIKFFRRNKRETITIITEFDLGGG